LLPSQTGNIKLTAGNGKYASIKEENQKSKDGSIVIEADQTLKL
jgi:hypothetical protein